MRKLLVAFVVLMSVAVPAVAQPAPEAPAPSLLDMIRVLSQRVDTLTARVDGGDVDHRAVAWIDVVDEVAQNIVIVQGWGFRCDQDARVALVVDDVETSVPVDKVSRDDVRAGYAAYCVVEAKPGANIKIDLTTFEPGIHADHRHVVKFRVYDWQNLQTDSLPMVFEVQTVFAAPRRFYNDGSGVGIATRKRGR